jgi:hypothetical protein
MQNLRRPLEIQSAQSGARPYSIPRITILHTLRRKSDGIQSCPGLCLYRVSREEVNKLKEMINQLILNKNIILIFVIFRVMGVRSSRGGDVFLYSCHKCYKSTNSECTTNMVVKG